MASKDFTAYTRQLQDIIRRSATPLSTIRPAEWTEQNVIMGKPFPGPYRYERTPYCREIIECFAQDHPARRIAVMKGAQIGFSAGVIYPVIGWIIRHSPGNTLATVGSPTLLKEAMDKIDQLIDKSGIRPLIRSSAQRKRQTKTGDTDERKDFPEGYLKLIAITNHRGIRQLDLQFGLFDDFEALKAGSAESGDTRMMLETRFNAYADTCKIAYISTPELKQGSNIESAYLAGDQRRYLVECPCCHERIELKWSIQVDDVMAGITWQTDNHGNVIRESVGYVCQLCAGFFTDKGKRELLNSGLWVPQAVSSEPDFYSYHVSALYAPIGMKGWASYATDYVKANPPGQPRVEKLHQTFVNVVLGETYEGKSDAPEAAAIQKNVRPYEPGVVPEKLSEQDGNGKIVLLTLACDMGGKIDDCRIDYEVVAWAANGATYSVLHGSIGTFVPRENSIAEKNRDTAREHWTYQMDKALSVWPVLDKLMATTFKTDNGREMQISIGGIDTGGWKEYTPYAYSYLDRTNQDIFGLKGNKENKLVQHGYDVAVFSQSSERPDLYLLQVGILKDRLANYMEMRWSHADPEQPPNFMNFPTAGGINFKFGEMPAMPAGVYQYENFYEHFQSEHRTIVSDKDGNPTAFRWEKKTTVSQNHMWDCRVYNLAMREIYLGILAKQMKLKFFSWPEYVAAVLGPPDK